jgi:predicted transcriptional regulator
MTEKSNNYLHIIGHDAFRYGGGLNKSAAEVYWFLLSGPIAANEVVKRTGRSRRTIFRVLSRMANLVDTVTGELIPMVKKDGDKWYALEVDFDHVARIVGTMGIGERNRDTYAQERREHRRKLELGKNQIKAGEGISLGIGE